MPLDDLGPTIQYMVLWSLGMYLPSVFAFVLVCRKERGGVSRNLALILLLIFPVVAPLAVFLHYSVSQLKGRKHRRKRT